VRFDLRQPEWVTTVSWDIAARFHTSDCGLGRVFQRLPGQGDPRKNDLVLAVPVQHGQGDRCEDWPNPRLPLMPVRHVDAGSFALSESQLTERREWSCDLRHSPRNDAVSVCSKLTNSYSSGFPTAAAICACILVRRRQ